MARLPACRACRGTTHDALCSRVHADCPSGCCAECHGTGHANGAALIRRERERQALKWTGEHDDRHGRDQITRTAIAYAAAAMTSRPRSTRRVYLCDEWRDGKSFHDVRPEAFAEPSRDGDIHNLVVAGALLAAEIDRRLRLLRKGASRKK